MRRCCVTLVACLSACFGEYVGRVGLQGFLKQRRGAGVLQGGEALFQGFYPVEQWLVGLFDGLANQGPQLTHAEAVL